MAKGYVVRGKDDGAVWLTAATLADVLEESPILSSARIYAVGGDGRETALLTYEEALVEVERLKRENEWLRHEADRAPRFVPFAGGEIS